MKDGFADVGVEAREGAADRPGTEAGDGATDAMRCDVIAPWNGNLGRTESGSPGDKPETVSEGQSKVMVEEECSTSGGMS